jgi:soluble lytic murein transglycosylase-like protein
MPATWAYVQDVLIGARVARTTDGNIRIGVAFLRQLLHQFRGNERLALAGYYQGPRSLRVIGMLPQTKAYVADVLALKTRL